MEPPADGAGTRRRVLQFLFRSIRDDNLKEKLKSKIEKVKSLVRSCELTLECERSASTEVTTGKNGRCRIAIIRSPKVSPATKMKGHLYTVDGLSKPQIYYVTVAGAREVESP